MLLQAGAAMPARSSIRQWRACLAKHANADGNTDIFALLCVTSWVKEILGFHPQLLYGLSCHVEKRCGASQFGGRPDASALAVASLGILDLLWDPGRLDVELARNMRAGVQDSRSTVRFSWGTAKANVGRLSLSNSVLACPTKSGDAAASVGGFDSEICSTLQMRIAEKFLTSTKKISLRDVSGV